MSSRAKRKRRDSMPKSQPSWPGPKYDAYRYKIDEQEKIDTEPRFVDQFWAAIDSCIAANEDYPTELGLSLDDWIKLCGELGYDASRFEAIYMMTQDGTKVSITCADQSPPPKQKPDSLFW